MVGAVAVFLIAAFGVIKLPDYFTRSHAVGMTDTLGLLGIVLGLMVLEGASLTSVKLLFLLLFLGIANPTVSHALMRAALIRGRKPWVADRTAEKNK